MDPLATRHGPIADDLERSLRICSVYGSKSIGRVLQWCVVKKKKPGVYNAAMGGISAMFAVEGEAPEGADGADGAERFASSKARQLRLLAEEFPGRIEVDDGKESGYRWGRLRDDP